jgi:hypothetical protein
MSEPPPIIFVLEKKIYIQWWPCKPLGSCQVNVVCSPGYGDHFEYPTAVELKAWETDYRAVVEHLVCEALAAKQDYEDAKKADMASKNHDRERHYRHQLAIDFEFEKS